MKVLNFGSLNLDIIYQVDHFVRPGETLAADTYQVKAGGKGLNQSIALVRAGAHVLHAGCIGDGGEMLKTFLKENGVDTHLIETRDIPQGQALIQVDPTGENAILLFAGSNHALTKAQVHKTLDAMQEGDYLILQNEVNLLSEIIDEAYKQGLRIVLNPSPFNADMLQIPYEKVDWILVNELEAKSLSGEEEPEKIREKLQTQYPNLKIVLTLGGKGAWCFTPDEIIYRPAIPTKAVDTTGAGDTFTGYFIAALMKGKPLKTCMQEAARAAAITVSRIGAAPAIPIRDEIK